MSGLKEADLAYFLRLIRHRLGSAGVLSQFAGVGRCHLSSMLHGDAVRGAYTWPKVRRHVTAVEWSFLEKCSAWNSFRQSSPEVADQVLRTPTADSRKEPIMQVVCADCGRAVKILRCIPEQGGKVSHGCCPACFTGKMTGLTTADEIGRLLQEEARADAANPDIIPMRPAETGEFALS